MKIAVIPARGGSKRIPRKNIKNFAGKPMIAHAIGVAQGCGLFDHVVVSTEDIEIAEIANKYGAEIPFVRPTTLADDFTATVPVVAHAINACLDLGWEIDEVCCIYPGVPFLQEGDLIAALHMLEADNGGYIFPITSYPSLIQRAFRQLPNGQVEPFYSQYVSVRTQDLELAFYDVGQFYWGYAQTWTSGKVIHQHGAGLVIPEWRSVDIDTADDWKRAELMYKVINNSKNTAY